MTLEKEDFVKVRSFLAGNVEVMLENLMARRESSKIDSEDLFASSGDVSQVTIQWQKQYTVLKRLDVLLAEKDSLGLYVSGDPLAEYQELLNWVRDTAGRDDIYLIILEKAKKIFTKAGTMMFALQVSMTEKEVEGIIFPKNAMRLSGLLEDKEIYWAKGNITERSRNRKKSGEGEDESEEGVQEFVELPKLAIEELVRFESGVLQLFEGEEIPLAKNRAEALSKVDWLKLKSTPKSDFLSDPNNQEEEKDKMSQPTTISARLPNNLGREKLMEFKTFLRSETTPDSVQVKLEIQDSTGSWQKVKGTYWLNQNELPSELRAYLQ